MNLVTRIENELDRLAALGAGRGNLELQAAGGPLRAGFTAVDKLACALDYLSYATTQLAEASIDDLKQRAEQLSAKLSYLLESISPIEIDDEACVVQMRSNPPAQDDDGSRYYELVVGREEIHLSRYGKSAGQPRQRVPANLTREVFARLATDIVASGDA